jgi:hypothetical protein
MLTYSLIFLTGLLGLLHQPWWTTAAVALLLAAITLTQDKMPARLFTGQAADLVVYTIFARLSLSVVAAASAFMLGSICRWIFGI